MGPSGILKRVRTFFVKDLSPRANLSLVSNIIFLQIVGHFKNAPVLKLGQAFAPRQFGRKLRVLKDFPKVIDEKNFWGKKFFFLSFLLTPLWKFHNGVTKIHNGVMKFITALWKSCHNVAARPRPRTYTGWLQTTDDPDIF